MNWKIPNQASFSLPKVPQVCFDASIWSAMKNRTWKLGKIWINRSVLNLIFSVNVCSFSGIRKHGAWWLSSSVSGKMVSDRMVSVEIRVGRVSVTKQLFANSLTTKEQIFFKPFLRLPIDYRKQLISNPSIRQRLVIDWKNLLIVLYWVGESGY